MRLKLPSEIPQIAIRVNGTNGFVIHPDVIETVSLHPRYDTGQKQSRGKAQERKPKPENRYQIERQAEKARTEQRYETQSTLRRSHISRSVLNRPGLALLELATAREHIFNNEVDQDRYNEKKRQREAEDASAIEALEPAPRVKKSKTFKNRGIDNRKAKVAPEGEMITTGELKTYIIIIALVLTLFLL